MTKKIVNESLKSPSLIGNIASYHKELIAKTAKRGVLVILSALFLCLQYLVLFFPTQSANSADLSSDSVYGGFSSKQDLLLEYEAKKSPFRDSAEALSVTRNDLVNTTDQILKDWVPTKSSLVVAWSSSPVYSMAQEDSSQPNNQHFVALSNDGSSHFFGHIVDAKYLVKSNAQILSGYSSKAGKFAILKSNGNFLTTNYNADTCYNNPNAYLSYTHCPSSNSFETKILVTNLSYKTEGQYIKNRPGDKLQYDLTLQNKGQSDITLKPELYIGDILEYSELTTVDAARFDKKTNTLQWPEIRLASGEKQVYSFGIQILGTIPINPRGSTNGSSYDCYMTSFFGEVSSIKVSCPTPKIIERMLSAAPENSLIALSWLVFAVNLLLWLKVYILSKEYDLIVKKARNKNV